MILPLSPQDAAPADAAVAQDFDPGYIISDRNFFNADAMSEAHIQAFLESKVTSCTAAAGAPTCLKDYRTDSPAQSAAECRGTVPAESNVRASRVIYVVAKACGINPMVLLVTLEKEQSLVTSRAPSATRYRIAMGYGCPDTAPCDTAYYGFANQLWRAARQFQIYTVRPQNFNHRVGATAVRFHPNAACGATTVNIRNQATANLYNYTPYQPNSAALANLYGSGDSCSSYGNRNFWRLYSDWFGSPVSDGVSPFGTVTSVTSPAASVVNVKGFAVDPDARVGDGWEHVTVGITIDVGDPGSPKWQTFGYGTANASGITPGNQNAYYGAGHDFDITVANVPPGEREVCAIAVNTPGTAGQSWAFGCTRLMVAYCGGAEPCPAVSRLSGDDRFAVSVQVSQRAFPGTAPVVYVTNGLGFADALAAAPAATRDGGPLLLTASHALPAAVAAEIRRLSPSRIVVVGGRSSVSEGVESELAAIAPVHRLDGLDRFESSRAVASTFGTAHDVYLATGLDFPDALTAGTLGSHQGRPVLLIPGSSAVLEPELVPALQSLGTLRITIMGGPNSVSPAVESALRAEGFVVSRVSGADRFAVSYAAQASLATTNGGVYVASGLNFPDALTGSVLAARSGAPLFLVRPDCLSGDLIAKMRQVDTSQVTLLGGASSLTARVASLTQCG